MEDVQPLVPVTQLFITVHNRHSECQDNVHWTLGREEEAGREGGGGGE